MRAYIIRWYLVRHADFKLQGWSPSAIPKDLILRLKRIRMSLVFTIFSTGIEWAPTKAPSEIDWAERSLAKWLHYVVTVLRVWHSLIIWHWYESQEMWNILTNRCQESTPQHIKKRLLDPRQLARRSSACTNVDSLLREPNQPCVLFWSITRFSRYLPP